MYKLLTFLGRSFQHPLYENIKNEGLLNSNIFDNTTTTEEYIPVEGVEDWNDLGNNPEHLLANLSFKDYDELLQNDTQYVTTSWEELLDTTKFLSFSSPPFLNTVEEKDEYKGISTETSLQTLPKTIRVIEEGGRTVTEESQIEFFYTVSKPIRSFRKVHDTTEKISKEDGFVMTTEKNHNTDQTTEEAITMEDFVFEFTLK